MEENKKTLLARADPKIGMFKNYLKWFMRHEVTEKREEEEQVIELDIPEEVPEVALTRSRCRWRDMVDMNINT